MRCLMLFSVVSVLASFSQASFAEVTSGDEGQPTVAQLRKEFSAELSLAKTPPPNERSVAILHLKVSGIKRVGYCRGRTSLCGLNPTCGHTGTKVDVVSHEVIGVPINDAKVEIPRTVSSPDFGSLGGSRFKVDEQLWGAYDVFRGGYRLLSPKKIPAEQEAAK